MLNIFQKMNPKAEQDDSFTWAVATTPTKNLPTGQF
jgi:hypothetical protein